MVFRVSFNLQELSTVQKKDIAKLIYVYYTSFKHGLWASEKSTWSRCIYETRLRPQALRSPSKDFCFESGWSIWVEWHSEQALSVVTSTWRGLLEWNKSPLKLCLVKGTPDTVIRLQGTALKWLKVTPPVMNSLARTTFIFLPLTLLLAFSNLRVTYR